MSFEKLFRRIACIDAIEMRSALLAEELERLSLETSLALIDEARRSAARSESDGQAVFLALGWAILERRFVKRRVALGLRARAIAHHHLADFLVPPPDGDPQGDDSTTRRTPDFGRERPLTLGERKSLARTQDRELIQRVVRDPHPDVVRILLNNPALTEDDVVRVCARRPNEPEVLRTVHRHRRWVVRYRPRHAIVRNPQAPLDTALLLAPLLRVKHLREAAAAAGLAPPLRLSCRSILELRGHPSAPPSS